LKRYLPQQFSEQPTTTRQHSPSESSDFPPVVHNLEIDNSQHCPRGLTGSSMHLRETDICKGPANTTIMLGTSKFYTIVYELLAFLKRTWRSNNQHYLTKACNIYTTTSWVSTCLLPSHKSLSFHCCRFLQQIFAISKEVVYCNNCVRTQP